MVGGNSDSRLLTKLFVVGQFIARSYLTANGRRELRFPTPDFRPPVRSSAIHRTFPNPANPTNPVNPASDNSQS